MHNLSNGHVSMGSYLICDIIDKRLKLDVSSITFDIDPVFDLREAEAWNEIVIKAPMFYFEPFSAAK